MYFLPSCIPSCISLVVWLRFVNFYYTYDCLIDCLIINRHWGTPANFNRFRILASLLLRRRSTEINQTLHDVWPSPGLHGTLHIHFQELLPLNGSLLASCKSHFASKSCVLLYWQRYCTALWQIAAFSGGRHLYSAGRPLRWALAHIVVILYYTNVHFIASQYYARRCGLLLQTE